MNSIPFTLIRNDEPIEIEIEYVVSEFIPGYSGGPPENWEPPSGGELVELNAYRDGEPFDITSAEDKKIEQHIYDTHDYTEH